ncbi:MAG TPA: LiaF domain-containing protein [Puia sp.]|nr:LiaF domain-containing protein [Puia sp.]
MNDDSTSPRRSGRVWAGLFLVCVGAVLVLDQMGFPLPYWLFSWHAFLIALGLFIGFRHGFRGGFWLILILIGLAFEFQDYYPQWELHRFILPGILILIGIMFVLNPSRHGYDRWHDGGWKSHWHDKEWKARWKAQWKNDRHLRKWGYHVGPNPNQFSPNPGPGGPGSPNPGGPGSPNPGGPGSAGTPGPGAYGPGTSNPGPAGSNPGDPNFGPSGNPVGTTSTGSGYSGYSSEDYLDTTAFFGGVHKKIVSKNFKGGDIVTIMGGTELDLSQADFTGMIKLDVVQIMGATKIIVPAHWEIRTDVTAIFAGFEDKRQQPTVNNPEKVLIIDGTSLMGGIELRNF